MKTWFPFTSYDFYAYLTTGMLALAAFDRVFMGSMLASENDWAFVSIAFWTAIAYLTGQLLAIPSSAIFEHVIARRILIPPVALLLGMSSSRGREAVFTHAFGARELAALPVASQRSILRKIADKLEMQTEDIDAETAFQCAFPYARSSADSAIRLDTFLNQYGMARNVSFASLLAALLLLYHGWLEQDHMSTNLGIAALILAVGLFGRFIKFYAAYAREVMRTFDSVC